MNKKQHESVNMQAAFDKLDSARENLKKSQVKLRLYKAERELDRLLVEIEKWKRDRLLVENERLKRALKEQQ
jgi:hypothetical protein